MAGSRIWTLICLGLTLLFLDIACVSVAGSDTGSTILYVYDGASNSVLAWDDVSTLYDNGSAGTASRTVRCTLLSGFDLGPGGMALDSNHQNLYLVSSGGKVVRISRIGSQDGNVSTDSDAVSITVGDSGTDAEGGAFGQASADPAGTFLYVTECNASSSYKSQIWAIPTSCVTGSGGTITKDTPGVAVIGNTSVAGGTSDKQCYGVAASSSYVYGYFGSGGAIDISGTIHSAPARLRKGTASGFEPSKDVIIGKSDNATTLLGNYGCLAYDTGNDRLYVARVAGASPLLAFVPGDFNPGGDVGPRGTFGGPTDLRVIAHAGKKDWLVGAGSTDVYKLWIWKAPSAGDTHLSLDLASSLQIRGLALDGSN